MVSPSDTDYQITKSLKKSGIPIVSPFRDLADWFESTYKVPVLNILYSKIIPEDRPRINVIFEKESDVLKFQNGPLGNFNSVDQKRVAEQFCEILIGKGSQKYKTKNLFVIFTAFEPIARVEANECVSDKDIKKLKKKIRDKNLWEISRLFDSVTFLFYTDQQVKNAESKGLLPKYLDEYSKLVAKYDEFGYHENKPVSAKFDSKQNFDKNFQSNWYYYYK